MDWLTRACDLRATEARLGELFAGSSSDRNGASNGNPLFDSPLITLSVRTAFDLYLSARVASRRFASGDEVLFAGANIPDMPRVAEAHGLRPVPVDFDLERLRPTVAEFVAASTRRTRALVVPQLFGYRRSLADLADVCATKGWDLIEDNAQSFEGIDGPGDPHADVSMASFGTIKRATVLGGGVAFVRDPDLREAMRSLNASLPQQPTWRYGRRWLQTGALLALSHPRVFGMAVRRARNDGRTRDELLSGLARGFAGGDFLAAIRKRPCPALAAWLVDRLERFPDLEESRQRTERLAAAVSRLGTPLGHDPNDRLSRSPAWVFPVLVDSPRRLIKSLSDRGLDATQQATLRPLAEQLPRLQSSFRRLVYLPYDGALPDRGFRDLVSALETI